MYFSSENALIELFYLVLELGWISAVDRHNRPIDMQFSDHRASDVLSDQLRSKCVTRALSQSQQTNKNILFGYNKTLVHSSLHLPALDLHKRGRFPSLH